MASVTELQLPPPILAAEAAVSSTASDPADAVIFFGISLVLGIACRHILKGTRVPYTVALLILGIGLGSLGTARSSSVHGKAAM